MKTLCQRSAWALGFTAVLEILPRSRAAAAGSECEGPNVRGNIAPGNLLLYGDNGDPNGLPGGLSRGVVHHRCRHEQGMQDRSAAMVVRATTSTRFRRCKIEGDPTEAGRTRKRFK